jgi:hypothetical protein
MNKDLPIYKLTINDDDTQFNWEYTAFVDKPATAELFMAFSEQKDYFQFKTIDEEKRIVMGALMVANLPIYRRDESTGEEFLVVFDAENIDLALQKHFKQKLQDKTNADHNRALAFSDVFMYQAWIINSAIGIGVPTGFNELPDGSAFGVFKVDNDEVWADVKAGKYKGFSIEGKFNREPMINITEEETKLLTEALEGSNLK